MEKITGTDLHAGISLNGDGRNVSKGIFIQSKWDRNLPESGKGKLRAQCELMLMHKISEGAFVWLCGRSSVSVITAYETVENPTINPNEINSKNLNEFLEMY